MTPIVSGFWVSRTVLAPVLALAAAASHPAWPPPITQTSYAEAASVANVLQFLLNADLSSILL